MLYSRQIETRYTTDVLVVGGGAAGIAAAIAAARMGKKVLLCESGGASGGVGTSGLVPAFAPFTDGENFLCDGIGLEIRKNISKDIPLDTYWSIIDAEELKREYDSIVSKSGVDFLFFTTLCDVVTEADSKRIDYAVFTSKTGIFAVKASVYIDCTGDGNLCAIGGGSFEIGDKDGNVMPPTLCSLWGNIDPAVFRNPTTADIEDAYNKGILSFEDRHLPGFFMKKGELYGYGGGNVGHIFGNNPLDEKSLTEAMVWGRKSMVEYKQLYMQYAKGCENLTLLATGSVLGIRESRRINCDYTLCVKDFIERAEFDDEIGRYCYPVDIHVQNTDSAEYKRFKEEYEKNLRYKKGESYGIPYRSLIPRDFANVLVAGRCMGTDRQMEASIRVMPGCFITGEAAGTAAAMACDKQGLVRDICTRKLQHTLAQNGAYMRKDLK